MSVHRFAALVLLLGGVAAAGREEAGRITVATDASYPPFESSVNGEIVGFDVDLVRAVAREGGLLVDFVDQPFDGILPGLRQGRYDAAVSAMTITEERARVVDFTDPYYDAGQVIAVRAGDARVHGLADLRGKVVAVQRGTTGHRLAERIEDARVKTFDAVEPAFLELLAGRADAVLNDGPTTLLYARQHAGIAVAGHPLTDETYGIAVRKGNADLLAKLNQGLRRVRASGEYDRLRQRWLDGSGGRTARGGVFVYLLGGLGLSILLWGCSLAAALVAGLAVALGRLSPRSWLRWPATLYVEIIRGVPLLVLVLWIYFGVLSDVLGRAGVPLHWFPASVLAFGACYAAFVGETYRAGIESVDPGQVEAARALGLSRRQAMRWIVLPQAVRNILPALGNEAIALFKDTSLATVIAVNELMNRGRQVAGRDFRTMETYSIVAALYLVTTLLFARLERRVEARLGAERRAAGR
ncbi:MAG: ABC transporter permease subunit [Minicystis sp.]